MYFNRTSIGGFHRYFQQLPYFPRGSTQLDPHVDLVQVLCLMPFPDWALLIFRDQHFECDPWDWIPVSSLSQTGCILFASVNHYTTDRLLGGFFSLFLWICLRFETFTWLWVNFLKKKKKKVLSLSLLTSRAWQIPSTLLKNKTKLNLKLSIFKQNWNRWIQSHDLPTYIHTFIKVLLLSKKLLLQPLTASSLSHSSTQWVRWACLDGTSHAWPPML